MKIYNTMVLALFVLSTPCLAQEATAPQAASTADPAPGALQATIVDVNNQGRKIEIFCQDADCGLMRLRYTQGAHPWDRSNEITITRAELELRANQKLERVSRDGYSDGMYTPYELTRNTLKWVNNKWARGYHAEAILGYLLSGLTAIVDTGGLPVSPVTRYTGTYRPQKKNRKNSRRLLDLIESGQGRVELKEKQFDRVRAGVR